MWRHQPQIDWRDRTLRFQKRILTYVVQGYAGDNLSEEALATVDAIPPDKMARYKVVVEEEAASPSDVEPAKRPTAGAEPPPTQAGVATPDKGYPNITSERCRSPDYAVECVPQRRR